MYEGLKWSSEAQLYYSTLTPHNKERQGPLAGQGIQGGNMPASLLYTICFCFQGDSVLMLFRNKPPNAQRWNGLGGKFQPGETPLMCVQREIMEEAGIDLHLAERLHFAGIVTWGSG